MFSVGGAGQLQRPAARATHLGSTAGGLLGSCEEGFVYIFQPVLLQSMQEECSFNECFVTVSSAERKGGQILFLAEVSVFSFRHCTLPISLSHAVMFVLAASRQLP